MDLHTFIQSGLLEAYLLGQCSVEESALVERMIAQHAEARAELAVIEQALEGYASANAVAPPSWMKGRILEIIENEAASPSAAAPSAPPPVSARTTLRLFQMLALALALLCGLFFFQKNNAIEEKTALQSRIAALEIQVEDCTRQAEEMDKIRQAVVLLRDRDTRAVPLADSSKIAAYAYNNKVRCEVAVDLSSLPAPEPGKHFQFWAIVDGKPVSMGMVDLQAVGGWQFMPCQENAVALAISLEDNPNGNATPTQVLLVGAVPTG